ncbi:uncharacterized protein LOC135095109 [Scylla paramamosain]|uniref:uncharacterized protein LOC135095109 n=1 Tax=Scylla paramamosain TaxID=85552 RepID=UPI0030836307
MLWCVAVVAAVVAAAQGQIVSYEGNIVNDNAQAAVVPSPPAQSFVFAAPAPAPVSQPPVFIQAPASFSSFVPPPQPQFLTVSTPAATQFSVPQGGLPVLPASCPSTYSLVHSTYHGSLYHFSWCYSQPGQRFSHQQAADYCRNLNHFSHPYHFEVLRIGDAIELSFINYLLSYYAHSAVWTGDTSSTAPYSIRGFINRSGANQPGHDCLSVEASLLALHTVWVHESSCFDAKMVVCEARY